MSVKIIYAESMKDLMSECNPSSLNCAQCETKIVELEMKIEALQKQVKTLSEGLVDVHNTFGDKVVFKAFCPTMGSDTAGGEDNDRPRPGVGVSP